MADPPTRDPSPTAAPAAEPGRAAAPAARPRSFLGAFPALRHRNYRLFFAGQGVSLVGTWLTRIATSWLVYRLTGSAALLGVVGFAGLAPTMLSPLAGVFVDRYPRRRVLVWTQTLSMLQSFALAVLTLGHVITVAEIVLLQLFQGLVNAFDAPARQAFVIEMVEDRADLPNAIALNSSIFNGARLVGPSLAGMLIAVVGEGGCFLLDGVSYAGVIAGLLAMRVRPQARPAARQHVLHDLAEGARYVWGSPPIRALLVLLAIAGVAGMPYTVLMPVVATVRLHGNASTLGYLMAATGLGALAAALRLAVRGSVLGLGRVITGMAILFGASLVAFAASRSLWLSLALLVVVGFAMMLQTASTNTVLQTIVAPEMRGRAMAFYTLAFMGSAPVGSLVAGGIAARIGAPWTIAIGGTICALAGLWFAKQLPGLREHVRPVYRKLGILPEIAEGLQASDRETPTPAA